MGITEFEWGLRMGCIFTFEEERMYEWDFEEAREAMKNLEMDYLETQAEQETDEEDEK